MSKADSNRVNAQKSTGPRDTTSTRFNAVNHGLLACRAQIALTSTKWVQRHRMKIKRLQRNEANFEHPLT